MDQLALAELAAFEAAVLEDGDVDICMDDVHGAVAAYKKLSSPPPPLNTSHQSTTNPKAPPAKNAAGNSAGAGSTGNSSSGSNISEIVTQAVRSVCDDFVKKFMNDSDSIVDLRQSIRSCNSTLTHMEKVLENFILTLQEVQQDIGDLKEKSMHRYKELDNAKSVSKVLQQVIHHVLLPPDVIHLVVGSNAEELGPQFTSSVNKLLKLLRARNGKQQQLHSGAMKAAASNAFSIGSSRQCNDTPSDNVRSTPSNGSRLDVRFSVFLSKAAGGLGFTAPLLDNSMLLEAYNHIAVKNSTHRKGGAGGQRSDRAEHHSKAIEALPHTIRQSITAWSASVTGKTCTPTDAPPDAAPSTSDFQFGSTEAENSFVEWINAAPPSHAGELSCPADPRRAVFRSLIFPVNLTTILTAFDIVIQQTPDGIDVAQVAARCGCQRAHLQEWRDSYGEMQRKCTQRLLDWLNDVRYHTFEKKEFGGGGFDYPITTSLDILAYSVDSDSSSRPTGSNTGSGVLMWLQNVGVSVAEIVRMQAEWVDGLHEWFVHKGQRQRRCGDAFSQWLNCGAHKLQECTDAQQQEQEIRHEAGPPSTHVDDRTRSAPEHGNSLAASSEHLNRDHAPETRTSHHAASVNSDLRGGTVPATGGTRSVEIQLGNCKAFHELRRMTDDLTVFCSIKIKTFLVAKMNSVLTKQRTNISVQQENVLRPYAPLVYFLRNAAPLLRESKFSTYSLDALSTHPPAATPASNLPHRIVKSLYAELRQQYTFLVSNIYHVKISSYISSCNALEAPHFFSGGENANSSGGGSSWTFFSGRAAASPNLLLPLLTDPTGYVGPSDFDIGMRASVIHNINAMPIIPHINQAKGIKHGYEETFRSLNVLLCDAVTREFLFSFDFFAGDTQVYSNVFTSTVQLIVDYVSEVILQNKVRAPLHSSPGGSSSSSHAYSLHKKDTQIVYSCNNRDVCGLLILIRLCHVFRYTMNHVRRLPNCLDSFYDSLLMLLWPAFKEAFDLQLASLRNLQAKQSMAFLSNYGSMDEKFAAVHPITLRYAEFSASLMALGTFETSSLSLDKSGNNGSLDDSFSGSNVQKQIYNFIAENDRAESIHRFAVLQSNLCFLRIEFLRMLQVVSAALAQPSNPAAAVPNPADTSRGDMTGRHVSACFLLNNVSHVLAVWSATRLMPTCIPDTNTDGATNTSPSRPRGGQQQQHQGSPANPSSRQASRGRDNDDDRSYEADLQRQDTGDSSTAHINENISASTSGLESSHDYIALKEAASTAKALLIEQVLTLVFPAVIAVIKADESSSSLNASSAVDDAAKIQAALQFTRTWKSGLDRLHLDIVRRFVTNANVQKDVLVQICMQMLLYNTRLHVIVGAAVAAGQEGGGGNTNLRSMIVTNQMLLQHMKTFACIE